MRGNTTLGEKFSISDIELNELEYGETYKYLGKDENIGYDRGGSRKKIDSG